MAHIQKRGSGRYRVRYEDASGREHSKTFRRRVDAEAFKSQVEVDVRRGDWIDPRLGRITLGQWADRWVSTTVDLRPSTRARDFSYLKNHVLPAFGATPIAQIDHLAVRTWVADLNAKDLKPATVHKIAQILSKLMAAAVDSGLISASPCIGVRLPRIEATQERFLNPKQVAQLAETIDPRYSTLVQVLAFGGLRISEAFGLTIDRVAPLQRRIEVTQQLVEVRGRIEIGPPKTSRGRRSVPLPGSVMDLVLAEVEGRAAEDFVFRSPNGGPVRLQSWRRRFWQPACLAAGLGEMVKVDGATKLHYVGLTPHDLRHTAVAFWIAAGASPNEIARRAGHASVATVLNRYGHLLPGTEEQVTDALEQMLLAGRDSASQTDRVVTLARPRLTDGLQTA